MRKLLTLAVVLTVSFILSAHNALAVECKADMSCDGKVNSSDLGIFKLDYGKINCDPCPAPAEVPKTGQTESYTDYDDGYYEKGVAWPNPRFTDNLDGTVTDNLTGLIWLQNANCFGQRTWHNALSDCNDLNSGECGLTDGSQAGDWRLANDKELFSLVDAENYNPALPSGHPFISVQSFYYWSSTTVASSTDGAWLVYMSQGLVIPGYKTDSYFVWPVRGGH